MKYTVIFEKTNTGFSAYVPDLPGCITTGPTKEQTEHNIQEAIHGHLALMREEGLPIPEPTTTAELIPA
jgi:predicted RNase H-like HicB family nuclease